MNQVTMLYITVSDYLPLLQIAEKREVKGKQERETYTQLNAEFQRIARGDKKALNNGKK